MDLIAKAKELFAAWRAGDWETIIRLLAWFVPLILDSLGGQPPPVPAMATGKPGNSPLAMSIDEMVDEAEAVCNKLAPQGAAAAPMQGPIIDALKPLLGKLILKLLLGIG